MRHLTHYLSLVLLSLAVTSPSYGVNPAMEERLKSLINVIGDLQPDPKTMQNMARDVELIRESSPIIADAMDTAAAGGIKAVTSATNAVIGAVANNFVNALNEPANAAKHERDKELAALKIGEYGKQAIKFFSSPKAIAGIAVIFGSFFLARYGFQVGAKYVESIIGKPTLVQDTSILSIKEKIRNFITGYDKPSLTAKDIILASEKKKEFVDLVKLTERGRENGTGYSHLLFYGPPGTGKTLGAKIISQMSGMDYAVIAGSSFSQFEEGKDIQELDRLIRWANRSKNGMVIFIDEADSALGVRTGKNARADNLVNFFLSNFERTTHPKIKLVVATNHPEKLDPAVMSRISKQIYVGLPNEYERQEQLKLNLGKIFVSTKKEQFTVEKGFNLELLAQKTENFTGRELYDLIEQFKEAVILADKTRLTWDIAEPVIAKAIASNKARASMRAVQEKGGHIYFNPESATKSK